MSDQQKLSVSYGSFACEIVGFQDPLPVLQDVIGEFRHIAWRFPGFGAQRDDAQRDRLSRLVAAKLNAALAENGVAVTLNPESGGLLVHPLDGESEGEGWGDLYAKPKPGESIVKSKVKHAAAPVVEAVMTPPEAAAPEAVAEPSAPEALAADTPAVESVIEEVETAAEAPAAPETPAEEQRVEDIRAEPVIEEIAPTAEAAPEPAAPEAPAEEPPVEEIRAAAVVEEIAPDKPVKAEEAIAAAPEEAEPEVVEPEDAFEKEDLIALQISQEMEAVVNTEIKDAFAELTSGAQPANDRANPEREVAETPKAGIFSRILGAKKKSSDPETQRAADQGREAEPLHLTGRDAAATAARPDEKPAARPADDGLDAAFDAIARQSGTAAKEAAKATEKDFVFANKDAGKSEAALLLSSENAVDPGEAEDPGASEERVAKAKAKVMERAKERQAAEVAATERRLRIIRRERVEEKSDEMAGALANAASGAPAMSASDFAKLAGAASLQELMEASAAYATLVGGKHKFTRSDLMEVMSELDKSKTYSPEARIKSFGKMLRTGVLLRVDDGLFAMSQNHRSPYEMKIHA